MLQKIDEAGNDTENEEQLPEALERMEHEAYGEAGEENLQSDTAVELVGTASEKDQAKEVKWSNFISKCTGTRGITASNVPQPWKLTGAFGSLSFTSAHLTLTLTLIITLTLIAAEGEFCSSQFMSLIYFYAINLLSNCFKN